MSTLSESTPLFGTDRDGGGRDERYENAINTSNTHHAAAGSVPPYDSYVRPVLGEFLGTMLFVCVGVLSVQFNYDPVAAPVPSSQILCIAVGHGLTLALIVVGFGEVSGAHVNPAVTLGALLGGALSPVLAALYVLAQLAGGTVGAGLARAILSSEVYKAIGGGAHTLGPGVEAGQGVLCEVLLTTVLVLTVLLSAVDPGTKSPLAPLAIGFAVLVDILAGGQISGASMNPARSLGPAIMVSSDTSDFWKYHYVYWVGPALGALVAAIFYRLILASREKRLVWDFLLG